jgi:DNA-directed RNA polymerase subunit RPC12/RpoP
VSAIADIKTESQTRELAKVPKAKRESVIKMAEAKSKSAGRKLTAKDIKAAASPEPITTTVVEAKSVEIQLRELWAKATAAERESFQEWIKSRPTGEVAPSCEKEFDDDGEAVALYECGECDTRFTRDTSANDNHQCPYCNKFGSKVTDCGCPECNEGELVNETRL